MFLEIFAARKSAIVLLGLTVPLVLLCAVGALFQRARAAQSESALWVAHTLEVEARVAALAALLFEAETSQRGFLVTGSEQYLIPYSASEKEVSGAIARLRDLTADNQLQQVRLTKLEPLIAEKFAIMARTLGLARSGDLPSAVQNVKSGTGKAAMDSIHTVLAQLNQEEERLLTIRQDRLERDAAAASIISWLLIALGFASCAGISALLWNIQKMQSLIKICAWSKTVEYEGCWMSFEEYLERRFQIKVSHGISPEEARKFLSEEKHRTSSAA